MGQQNVETLIHTPQVVAGVKFTGISGSAAGATGVWAWIGENASQLTVVFGFVGMLCAIGGLVYTVYQGNKAMRRGDDDETLNR